MTAAAPQQNWTKAALYWLAPYLVITAVLVAWN
jgi:hypothetical protein